MITTPHPTHAGLLRTICEHPAQDTPRLVYADWLEENGQEEQAEFVRVQCEVAKLLAGPALLPVPTIARKERIDALRHRERELLSPGNEQQWLTGFPLLLPEKGSVVWRRGFVAEVSCRLADWCGQECERCRGAGEVDTWAGTRWGCSECGGNGHMPGTGRVNAHGPAIVQAAPLEQVTLDGEHIGHREHANGFHEWYLPDLHPLEIGPAVFSSKEALLHALSRSALTWARQQAGLPVPPV